MKYRNTFRTALLLLSTFSTAIAQVASHAPSSLVQPAKAQSADAPTMALTHVTADGRPVLRINGTVLTDRDLLHEMYALFPYAAQHNGFPKDLEGQIRDGAKQMLIFEELVYQEGERRKIPIAAKRIDAAEAQLRQQLGGSQAFNQFVQVECNGSLQVLRKKVRRSLLIDLMLKREVADKSVPTLAEQRAFYNKNIQQYTHGETFHLQTISIIPPATGGPEVKKEARRNAEEAYKAAKNSKSYQEFGLLAEKYSDDDWHVNNGDRKGVESKTLPPPVLEAIKKMKPGDVSPLIQLGDCYTIVRLVARNPPGTDSFLSVRKKLLPDLTKAKTDMLRTQLNKKLHKGAKIEEL